MSDKMRMQAVDKIEVKAAIKVITRTKLERVAAAGGLKIGTYIAAIIEEHVSRIETLAEDLERTGEIIAENIERRERKKKEKGVR